jgi:alginate O-acetyltransferase complex protein AlgI
MEPFVPASPVVVAVALGALVLVLFAGGALALHAPVAAARAVAWALLLAGTAGVERLTTAEPAGFRMLVLIAFALLSAKCIVVVEERANGMQPLPFPRWLGFAGAWLGMRPRLFARRQRGALPGARDLLARGAAHLALGSALVLGARLAWTSTHSRLLATLLVLPGLSLVLHFGLCNLLAGTWRLRGVACDALFRAPLRSTCLAEFWGRRWNLAFSEMTGIAVYRPLSARLGQGAALFASFLVSGLLHELAISLPVRAGFGLPLLYFALHGALVTVERARARAGRTPSTTAGRAWTLAALGLPLPILFHHPFLAGVVWPLIGIEPGA